MEEVGAAGALFLWAMVAVVAQVLLLVLQTIRLLVVVVVLIVVVAEEVVLLLVVAVLGTMAALAMLLVVALMRGPAGAGLEGVSCRTSICMVQGHGYLAIREMLTRTVQSP